MKTETSSLRWQTLNEFIQPRVNVLRFAAHIYYYFFLCFNFQGHTRSV